MATDEELLRQYVIAQALINIPRAFLADVHDRILRAYPDKFAEVAFDKTCIPEQRIFKLVQDRCFRIDWELMEAAKAHGLITTSRLLPLNKWQHTFVSAGAFGLTQSYVQRMGDLPQPAKFRDELAEAARCPQLPLDDPAEIYQPRQFYALFGHNPVGREFTAEKQQLGALMFCVPHRDMKSWAVEISVPELIAEYPAETKEHTKLRGPTWKPSAKRDEQ
jgi:hypothetical protein